MRTTWRTAVGLLGIAAAGALASARTQAQTADELVAKNLAARGGLEKIRAVQSMRLTGTMSIGDERMPAVLELKRPEKMRWEFTVDGQVQVEGYDGKTGWTQMTAGGRTIVEPMSADEQKDVALQADMDGPFVDYRAKGIEIELVGKEKVNDRDAWKLRVTLQNGEKRDVYLDAGSFLQVKTVMRREVDGQDVEVTSTIEDYREVGGLLLPHSFEASATGAPGRQVLHFDRIELNVPLDDGRFETPKPTQEPPPGPTPAPAIG
jgi:outer membrane lipoprotein-sorting protein